MTTNMTDLTWFLTSGATVLDHGPGPGEASRYVCTIGHITRRGASYDQAVGLARAEHAALRTAIDGVDISKYFRK